MLIHNGARERESRDTRATPSLHVPGYSVGACRASGNSLLDYARALASAVFFSLIGARARGVCVFWGIVGRISGGEIVCGECCVFV